MSLLISGLAITALFTTTLFPPPISIWGYLSIWVVRAATISLLFRTFLGPFVLRLLSSRLRVRSISLRSIRGIYFRSGSGILRVDRIGLSYHRPSVRGASRFSVKVEGLRVDITELKSGRGPSSPTKPRRSRHPAGLSPLTHRAWTLSCLLCSRIYRALDPYVRPIVRTAFVSTFRFIIRALPALTQGLDFELNSASITLADVPGVELVLEKATLQTSVELSVPPTTGSVFNGGPRVNASRHRRFGSVVNWNARLAGSVRRTWDRAWGATEVAATVSLNLQQIKGNAYRPLLQLLNVPLEEHDRYDFLAIPHIHFSTSAHLDPHKGIQSQSVEVVLGLDRVEVDVDVLGRILTSLKRSKPKVVEKPALPPSHTPLLSASPSLSALTNWGSPLTAMSGNSQLMGVLSASMRFRRHVKSHPVHRVHSRAVSSRLGIMKAVHFNVATISLKHRVATDQGVGPDMYTAAFQSISVNATLSHPDRNPLHREWLGRSSVPADALTPDMYAVSVSAREVSLDRDNSALIKNHVRVVRLGPIVVDSVVSQYPSPWLQGPTFLAGDPNSQLVFLNVSLGDIEVTERLEILQSILKNRTSPKPRPEPRPILPTVLSPVPKVQFGLEVGKIRIRLISSGSFATTQPFALEARSDSFVATMTSSFLMVSDKQFSKSFTVSDHSPLVMRLGFEAVLERTFVKVHTEPSSLKSPIVGSITYSGEPILSLDALHLTGDANALGEMAEETGMVVTIDVPSTVVTANCSTEALSVELWQPDAIGALSTVLRALPSSPKEQSKSSQHILDQLPTGLLASVSIARVMIFVTGPDLAPGEDLNISRGVAAHSGISLSYCAIRGTHVSRLPDLYHRKQQRLRLSLSEELVDKAYSHLLSSLGDETLFAVSQVSLWDAAFRDALATGLSPDDPYGIGDSSRDHRSKEFLNIKTVTVNIMITGHRSNGLPVIGSPDDCQISVSMPSIVGSMHLAHVYNILLATNTLISVRPPAGPSPSPSPSKSPTLRFDLTFAISRVQVLWDFPLGSQLYLRAKAISTTLSSQPGIHAAWESLILATSLDSEGENRTRVWDEVIRLVDWRVAIQPSVHPVSISIDANTGRIRIPFGFVFADLILDVVVTMKSIKHLINMVPTGRFEDPPTPEAEGPKSMPDLKLRVRSLSAEVIDEGIESRLGLLWKAGHEASRIRRERDEAFQAKVEAIIAATHPDGPPARVESDFQFGPGHSVSIAEARDRLWYIHSGAWKAYLTQARERQKLREHILGGKYVPLYGPEEKDLVDVNPPKTVPPMFRIFMDQLGLHLTSPSFPENGIPDFLFSEGGGMPKDTEYSLLVPMHLNFTVASLRIGYRDYPLPLLNIPRHSRGLPSFEFNTDLVIAEEMGTDRSVERINCAIVKENTGIYGASPLSIAVPKTIMPVKTYANPTVKVTTDEVTDFTWGVSYGPVTQDFMRVIDTLSHAPRDTSPPIGFWDKLRLVFHWRVQILFDNEVHLHLKGSPSPFELQDYGAGFALCWRGKPKLLIGQENEQNELMQLVSESMLITIPNVEGSFGEAATPGVHTDHSDQFSTAQATHALPRESRDHCKVCAKLTNGVRFGIGIALERSCGPECPNCTGRSFQRQCCFFTFRPHHEVKLELKSSAPEQKSHEDSYNGFRSDFIHMSISLLSSLNGGRKKAFSSIHLSPRLFAHFWEWWTLFDGKALPIRQGALYKHKRPLSPKFGQHLATIKYRISLGQLFISHVYMDNSREAWTDGVTPFVGVKAMIDLFQADMHQRAQETTTTAPDGTTKTIAHKPFYAIEVVMKGIELRTLLAIFPEPLKQLVPLESSPLGDSYRTRDNIPVIDPKSPWVDLDDFVEIGWSAEGTPVLHVLPAALCPRFTYFRRSWDNPVSAIDSRVEISKFGSEDTHVCLLGKESSVPQVQIGLAKQRIIELKRTMTKKTRSNTEKMIALLTDYMTHLQDVDNTSCNTGPSGPQSYYMPSDSVSPEDWAAFNNVYQVHCPQIFLDNIIRDIMMQYYYCSRARRGFEYHMATRAVKFIRDQANTIVTSLQIETGKNEGSTTNVHAAAIALRKLLTGESDDKTSIEVCKEPLVDLTTEEINPMNGWSDDVSIRKGHFCLLLKPQIVLRSEASADAVCILAAVQGKLQSYAVMDNANADDPVSGKVMSRNYASITGLQTFSPSAANKSGEGCVPLEVLVDLRCENSLFDRLVPQTDATFHYDKFNKLRLQNNVISTARTSQHSDAKHNHFKSQTDLIRFHVPRFTVSANDRHFQAISTILTSLVLYSDAALKVRSDRLEKLLFSYDFTNMASAADVVENLQARLRHAVEMKRDADHKLQGYGEEGEVEKLKIVAHILLLSEELDLVFEAINMAQDKAGDKAGQKSALLLHASSSEISWRMLDRHDQLLAKLALRDINFYWLSRQDSSTVNNLALGDLQAFDGAADAEWTEVLSKYEEKSDHPLVKKNLFLLADWTVLPPVGGITIYEAFDLALHPMRLQIDTRVGKKIMEYVWPARRNRPDASPTTPDTYRLGPPSPTSGSPRRASLDIPSPTRKSIDTGRLVASPLRRLGTSRSFTDLRNSRQDTLQISPRLHRTKSTDALYVLDGSGSPGVPNSKTSDENKSSLPKESDDAAEMKTRSSQKTFVWVRVASLHLMLSIMKENSFLCRDARIRTRVLEYRNQTWSFEELVDQFIPSGRNWKGWVKMAFNQPLVPVLPVARELIAKTKWVSSSKGHSNHPGPLKRKGTAKLLPFVGSSRKSLGGTRPTQSETTARELSSEDPKVPMPPMPPVPPLPSDAEQATEEQTRTRKRSRSRTRVLSLFKRKHHHESNLSRSSVDSDASVSTASSFLTDHSAQSSVPPTPVAVNQPGSGTL